MKFLILNTYMFNLQLFQNGKKVVMMGDDTWTQLFPHHFERSYPYPSFNVKDLHTVSLKLCWIWLSTDLLILVIDANWVVVVCIFCPVYHSATVICHFLFFRLITDALNIYFHPYMKKIGTFSLHIFLVWYVWYHFLLST
jgi:hypothetical protein